MGTINPGVGNVLQSQSGSSLEMSDWTIFAVGLLVTMLVAGGLFYTVLEFRDIERTPEAHEPKSYRRIPQPGKVVRLSGLDFRRSENGRRVS